MIPSSWLKVAFKFQGRSRHERYEQELTVDRRGPIDVGLRSRHGQESGSDIQDHWQRCW
jgi:hypothetical protein